MTKRLLDFSGKELEAELERLIKENPPRERKWTEKEMEILRRLKGKVPYHVIAKQLERSKDSVEHKAVTL